MTGASNDNSPPLDGLVAAAQSAQAKSDRGPPPVHLWNPSHCGEIDIRIRADGLWFHEGSPIGRQPLVRLFSTVLRKDDDGFVLVTPGEKLKIMVDDAPFVAVGVDSPAPGVLRFVTNVGDMVEAGPDHPIRVAAGEDGAPRPYVHVRGGLEALIARTVFAELAASAAPRPGDGALAVASHGVWFSLDPAA